jgi:hypothetical protein
MRRFSSSNRSARDTPAATPAEGGRCCCCGVPIRDCEFMALLELDMWSGGLEPLLMLR